MLDDAAVPLVPAGAASGDAVGQGLAVPAAPGTWTGCAAAGFVQSMSQEGETASTMPATEQLFGHVKDEFYRGREWNDVRVDFKRGPGGIHRPLEHEPEAGRD